MSSKKLKLCYFINSDWYFELHWLERAKSALDEGYKVYVMCNFCTPGIRERLMLMGFFCHETKIEPHSINPLGFTRSFFNALRIIRKIKPNLIHCITIKPCLIGGLISRYYRIGAVISFAGLGRVFSQQNVFIKLIRIPILKLFKFILNGDRCHVTFEHEKDRSDFLNACKVTSHRSFIINGAGVDIEEFPFVPDPVCSQPVVLFAARMLWSKGIGDLIAARDKLAKQKIYFNLHVAGIECPGDPDAIPHEQIMAWHAESCITWLGRRSDMQRIIQECNVVVLPSIYSEGIPRILLEAAATGRAGLAYDSGGCKNIVINGITGFIVNPGNVEQLSDMLGRLISEPGLRKSMGLKAREIVESEFSSKKILAETLELYRISLL